MSSLLFLVMQKNNLIRKQVLSNSLISCTVQYPKKTKLDMYLEQQSKVPQSLFLLYVQVKTYSNMLKLRCQPLTFNLNKASLFFFSICIFFYEYSRITGLQGKEREKEKLLTTTSTRLTDA